MTNRDYKEGFDGGIDFALTFVGQAYGTKFADLNELVAFIERKEQVLKATPTCPHCDRELEDSAELAAGLCTSDDCPRHDATH